MRSVFPLRGNVDLLLFIRPAIKVCDYLVRTRGQIQAQRRAAARFSVHKNLRAARFTGDAYDRADKGERFGRGLGAFHFDFIAHFPIAAAGDDRIFTGWKIGHRLWRHAFAGNLTVFASERKLRARGFGLDLKRAFTSHESKWRQINRVFTPEVDTRFYR